ncbi:uncharacterized protein LOC106064390 isoform X2 [Biomphalaria glabrata]|uniref:Uncharacterized protein LOC106064390 isoform X2 n=1 Tax=Biomphalaria glabrata TaxID=6526 RepID=A0A9W3B350_BIOGL|nr:uncharacterized protein LOC106064390 isoform X2 [Biomphalaria glabrata]XP_055893909.1 uncharacterized protein LOC106064390 isoform X2 [Biomphalaria glabrata]XP_055893910.1 uncharacterized protein LOC106064390 isoform X2 [Biomphalaria glabrata]XP_055893911.1 uncharacterized protein LOC106064390 isoform X2 [Biomphalaria glabrata]
MEHTNTRTSQIERLARNGLEMEGDSVEKGELLSLRGNEETTSARPATSHGDENDVSYSHEDSSVRQRPKNKRRAPRFGSGDNCCSSFLKCLGLVPCPSLLSWIILLCGIGCLTGSLLIGTWRTRELLKGDEDLLWFMEYTIIGVTIGMFVIGTLLLTTGHLSTEPTSRRIFNSLTKNRCAQGLNICALVVAYILTIIWILVSVVLATPLVLLINIICIVNPESIDPSLYGFKSGQITRTQFHEDGVNLLITYAIALFGSILIVNSLICFLISISANITHLRDNRFATFNTYSPGEEIHCSKHSVVDTNM